MSRRRDIANHLITNLQLINGNVSTLNSSYTYYSRLDSRVYRGLSYFDEINDYPSLYLAIGPESRIYHSSGLTTCDVKYILRCYIMSSDECLKDAEKLAQDIEHVLYHLPTNNSIGLMNVTIDNIEFDLGLNEPYAFFEVLVNVQYEHQIY